jgi:streptogramin lyase
MRLLDENVAKRVPNPKPHRVAAVGPNSVAVDATGVVYFTERTRPHVLRLDPATGRVTLALGR